MRRQMIERDRVVRTSCAGRVPCDIAGLWRDCGVPELQMDTDGHR